MARENREGFEGCANRGIRSGHGWASSRDRARVRLEKSPPTEQMKMVAAAKPSP